MPHEPRGAPALELVPGIGYRTRIRFGEGQRERFLIKLLDVNAAAKRDRELRELARLLTNTTAENFSMGQISCDGAIWPKIWMNLPPPDSSSTSTVSVPV